MVVARPAARGLLRRQRLRAPRPGRCRAGIDALRGAVAGARPRLVRVHRLRAGASAGALVRDADGTADALATRIARGEEECGARRPDDAAHHVIQRRGTTEAARPDCENGARHRTGAPSGVTLPADATRIEFSALLRRDE